MQVLDKEFELYITHEEILNKVKALAEELNKDYNGKCPIMVCILNGAFIFAADLVREVNFPVEIGFMKYSSYVGLDTVGIVDKVADLAQDVKGRDIIVVEDIIDTGYTMERILRDFKEKGAASVKVACLLQKPKKLITNIKVDYCALDIKNEFIVGYGLDYNGHGRNLKDIYILSPDDND